MTEYRQDPAPWVKQSCIIVSLLLPGSSKLFPYCFLGWVIAYHCLPNCFQGWAITHCCLPNHFQTQGVTDFCVSTHPDLTKRTANPKLRTSQFQQVMSSPVINLPAKILLTQPTPGHGNYGPPQCSPLTLCTPQEDNKDSCLSPPPASLNWI